MRYTIHLISPSVDWRPKQPHPSSGAQPESAIGKEPGVSNQVGMPMALPAVQQHSLPDKYGTLRHVSKRVDPE